MAGFSNQGGFHLKPGFTNQQNRDRLVGFGNRPNAETTATAPTDFLLLQTGDNLLLQSGDLLGLQTGQGAETIAVEPSDFSSLYAWYTTRSSSSIGTPNNGDALAGWNDISGHARHLTSTGSPTFLSNALGGYGAVNFSSNGMKMSRASFFSSASWTVITVSKIVTSAAPIWDTTTGFYASDAASSPTQRWTWDDRGTIVAGPNSLNSGTGFVFTASQHGTAAAYSGSIGLFMATIDGQSHIGASGGLTIPPVSGNTLEFPASGTMQVCEMILYNRKLSRPELSQLRRSLCRTYGLYNPRDCAVINIGNSTTQGVGNTGTGRGSWTSYLAEWIDDVDLEWNNLGYSGGDIADMEQQGPEILNLIDYYVGIGRPVVCTLFHGHNDMSAAGESSLVIDHFSGVGSTLFADIRSHGAKLLVMTPTMRNGNANYNTNKTAVCSWLESNWSTYFDAFVDLRTDPTIGTNTCVTDYPAYWADSVHPSDTGYQQIATNVETPLRNLIEDAMA